LGYYGPNGSQGFVDGNWCKVLHAKDTDTLIKQDIELEPGSKKSVHVVDADGKPVTGVQATGISHENYHFAQKVETDTITIFNLEPSQKRLVAGRHAERKLVGTVTVNEADENPVLKLGPGGTAKGRAVGADGKALAGITATIYFARREVAEVYSPINSERFALTDSNGEFSFDTLMPGYSFRFLFTRGKKSLGPDYQKAKQFEVKNHGDVLDVGNLVVTDQSQGEE
jgi:hypothetical protein